MDINKFISEINMIRLLIPLIVGLFTIIVLKPGIITLFTASKSEILMMNKEIRKFIYIVKYIVFVYLFPISLYHSIKSENWFVSFFDSFLPLLVLIPIIGVLFWVNNKKFTEIKYIDTTWMRLLLVFSAGYYCIYLGLFYSALLFSAFETRSIGAIGIVILATFLYWLLLKPPIKFFLRLDYEEIKVKIRLSNGQVIRDAYLLYPTHGKQILLGDNLDADRCFHKIALPLSKIEYIEFFITKFHWGKPYTTKNSSITIHKSR